MKKTYLALALATTTFFACNSGTSSGTGDSTTSGSMGAASDTGSMNTMNNDTSAASATTMNANTKPVSDMDKKFMMDAAAGGNTEIMASQMAQSMSTNQKIKDFAGMMITDHTKAGDELKTIASQKNVTLPDSVMDDQHRNLDDLRKKSGKDFDKAYVKMMVKDHKETVDKFQMASEKCDDGDVKSFAAKTLPTIKMHKDAADALNKGM